MDCIGSHEAPDVLWGAAEIGRAIGKAARATFHLLEAGHLPARKIGGRWCAGWQCTPYQGASGGCRRAEVIRLAAEYLS